MISHWLWIEIPALLLIVIYVLRRIGEARDDVRYPPPGEMVDIGGRKLHMVRKGSGGPTIVFESGASMGSSFWWPLQDRLTDFTTISYDRAGIGWSESSHQPITLEARAADLHALLAAAKIPGPYVLVGISYGGPLLRLFARDHREQIGGLIFLDVAHEAVISSPEAQKYLKIMARIFRTMHFAARVGLLRVLGFKGISAPPTALPLTPAQMAAARSRASRPSQAGKDEFLSTARLPEAMANLNAPGLLGNLPLVVISHGVRFPGFYAAMETNHGEGQRQLAALSSNSELIVAEKCGHAIPWDDPELVLDTIKRMVASIRKGNKLSEVA